MTWGATGPQGPAGPVHQVTGVILPSCELQVPIAGVSVTTNGPNGCTISFDGSLFTFAPLLILTPIGGDNPTSITEGGDAGGWTANYSFASSPPLVNFIASQASQ